MGRLARALNLLPLLFSGTVPVGLSVPLNYRQHITATKQHNGPKVPRTGGEAGLGQSVQNTRLEPR